jgi:putative ABC transport system substrate-binding protein
MKNALKKQINVIALFCVIFSLIPAGSAYSSEKTIGFIMTSNIPYYNEIHSAFSETLKAEGFGPDRVKTILQRPVATKLSWVNAIRKFIAYDVDMIVSYGAPATIAASTETSGIPIIFSGVYDYKALGIKNQDMTGIISKVPITTLLKHLRGISSFKKLGVLFNVDELDTVLQKKEIKDLEGLYNFKSISFNVNRLDNVSDISGIDALFFTSCGQTAHLIDYIIGIAYENKMPTASIIGTGEDSGVILTLMANAHEQGTEAAKLASKVFNGTEASALPIIYPKNIEFTINLKEAKKIGLEVPFDLMSLATKVIKQGHNEP